MNRRRDRHGRGLRGPLARTGRDGLTVPLGRTRNRAGHFSAAVGESVARIARQCPEALHRVQIGWEEVPHLAVAWTGGQVPLALAVEATEEKPARVVLYRRPLEHRTESAAGLKSLIHRTVVEQLAALTGLGVDIIDPLGYGEDF